MDVVTSRLKTIVYPALFVKTVDAKAKVNSRSLSNNVDSDEKINLPFINELYQAKTTEASIIDDALNIPPSPSSKIKLRKKKKKYESQEDSEPRRKSIKKKHRKKGRSRGEKGRRRVSLFSKTFGQDNSTQSESGERRKPFDIVVHIKVNEFN